MQLKRKAKLPTNNLNVLECNAVIKFNCSLFKRYTVVFVELNGATIVIVVNLTGYVFNTHKFD